MDIEEARSILPVNDSYDEDCLHDIYLRLVKEKQDDPDFEEFLKKANIARDFLREAQLRDTAVALVKDQNLAETSLANRAVALKEAKLEFSADIKKQIKSKAKPLRERRNASVFLTSASAGAIYLKSNIPTEIIGQTWSAFLTITLLAIIVISSVTAFYYQQAAKKADEVILAAEWILTRRRVVFKLLNDTFSDKDRLDVDVFQSELAFRMSAHIGINYKWRTREKSFVKIAKRMLRFDKIGYDDEFVEQYVDYLLETEYIQLDAKNNEVYINPATIGLKY